MADYIYLLNHRLSGAQQRALHLMEETARAAGLTLFLVGGAVRDLTSGAPVRDLDFAVQGDALELRKALAAAGAQIMGENKPTHTLYLELPGGVRAELGSTLSATWPKPGKPVYQLAPLLEDLRRRDFTANAMALSLNEGSYGLLMDPLNGVADIENRELRLVSNYGFIEEPVRIIRAARLQARLGWQLEAKTQTRYETGKAEDYIAALSDQHRGYEIEEILYEEDPLRVLRRLEAEGWMKSLAPAWTSAKANTAELERLREVQTQLEVQGVHADPSVLHLPLLMAKLSVAEMETLRKSFVRPGLLAAIDNIEKEAKAFAAQLTGKDLSAPSAAWKHITSSRPEVVLAAAFSVKSAAVQARFKSFLTEWPQARQKIPFALMQEMRIVPELPGYNDLVESLFFELMDGRLGTTEEMKAFLEPHSPPAPPPPVNLRRGRGGKKDSKGKGRGKKTVDLDADLDDSKDDGDSDMDLDADEDSDSDSDSDDRHEKDRDDEVDDPEDEDDEDEEPVAAKPARKPVKAAPAAAVVAEPVAAIPETVKPEPAVKKTLEKAVAKAAPIVEKPVPVAAKATPVKVAAPAKETPAAPAKKAAPATAKPAPVKIVAKAAPVKASAPAKKTAPAKAAPAVKTPVKSAGVKGKAAPAKKIAAPVKAVKPAPVPAKKAAVPAKKIAAKPAAPAKTASKKIVPPVKAVAKKAVAPVKAAVKTVAKKAAPAKSSSKSAPAKTSSKKAVPKKVASKTSKRR